MVAKLYNDEVNEKENTVRIEMEDTVNAKGEGLTPGNCARAEEGQHSYKF